MVATESRMVALGAAAPSFALPDVSTDNICQLHDFQGKPLLVMFICNHCPYVVHVMQVLASLANEKARQGLAVVAISANDVENYPQDSPEKMREFAEQYGFEFPYCYDESQEVARAFQAECTPDFFLFDAEHKLQYRGQLDGSRPGNTIPVTGAELEAAIDAVIAGEPCSEQQIPSIGCNIKWKAEI